MSGKSPWSILGVVNRYLEKFYPSHGSFNDSCLASFFLWDVAKVRGITFHPKNMMKGWKIHPLGEDVFPIENGKFPVSHVSFQGCI